MNTGWREFALCASHFPFQHYLDRFNGYNLSQKWHPFLINKVFQTPIIRSAKLTNTLQNINYLSLLEKRLNLDNVAI